MGNDMAKESHAARRKRRLVGLLQQGFSSGTSPETVAQLAQLPEGSSVERGSPAWPLAISKVCPGFKAVGA